MNLKKTLTKLRNTLVTDRGVDPEPIVNFINWLDSTSAAQEILAEMDVEWPMVVKVFKNKLHIPDFSIADASSVEIAYKQYEATRKTYNDSVSLLNQDMQSPAAHTIISKSLDAWRKSLGEYWLSRPDFKWRVADTVLTFQAFGSNYDVDDLLNNHPLKSVIVADSESGQGFWFLHHDFITAAKDIIAKKVKSSSISKNTYYNFIWGKIPDIAKNYTSPLYPNRFQA